MPERIDTKAVLEICTHLERPRHARGMCHACYGRWYRLSYPDKVRAYSVGHYAEAKHSNHKREYGWRARGINFTHAQYDAMLIKQGGVCAMCGSPPKTRYLSVDHDHRTGQVRGLLCGRCNRQFLPLFERNRERILAYLGFADHEADRNRLEQQEAEAQDKAHPQIRPMTQLENAYMDLEGKLGQANARIEALEIKAATWLALASPIWVGDESEGHFVCLACNQAGTDDGGCKTIQHLPDCEYAAALAAEKKL